MTPLEQQTRTEAVVHCAIIDLLDGRKPKRPLTLEQREFFRKEMLRLSRYLDTESPAEAKMTDAREIIAKSLEEKLAEITSGDFTLEYERDGQTALQEVSDAILAALTAAGFRIVGPGEVDLETVEKCAEVADAEATKHQGPFTSQPAYVASCAIRDALRDLKEKQR